MREPPLARSYPAHVVLLIVTLSPGLINGSAFVALTDRVGRDLHVKPSDVLWLPMLSDAALVFGCIVAAELSRWVEARRFYLTAVGVSLVTTAICLLAPNFQTLLVAHILHGLVAGFLVVIAIAPIVSSFEAEHLATTAGVLIAALFGASALGPLAGTLAAAEPFGWRRLFGIEIVMSATALWLGTAVLLEKPPQRTSDAIDVPALALAISSTILVFVGVGMFELRRALDLAVSALLALGIAGLSALIVVEARAKNPLLPVKALQTALPFIGIFTCVVASAIYAAATAGVRVELTGHGFSLRAIGEVQGIAFVGAAIAAFAYARVATTRYGAPAALAGLLFLFVGCACAAVAPPSVSSAAATIVILSIGAGLTITPGLFTMVLSVEPRYVPRAIAFVALYRLAATYLTGPVMQTFARSHGVERGFILLALASASAAAIVVAVFVHSGAHLQAPRVDCLLKGTGPALESPPI